MKIFHILDHSIPLHSGYTFRSRAILENQRKLGWQTDHLTSPKHNQATKNDIMEETVDGFHFYRSLPKSDFLSTLPVLNQRAVVKAIEKRLEQTIDKVKPDILHAHSPALNGLAAVKIGKRFNIPIVYEIRAFWEDAAVDHGTTTEGSLRYRLTKMLETRVINQADAVTTICEGLKNDIVGRGVPQSKVTVIPNAVDPEKFKTEGKVNETLQSQLGLVGKKVLGFIGSFYAYEGLPLLVEAFSKILQQRNDIRVLLVGGGPQEEKLKQLVTELGLDEHIIFTGRVPHDQVQLYYDLVDIFVYPRLSMRLTELVTPLKPLEAMAQGRMIVASDVGGHKELIEHGKTGFLFKADDVSDLAAVITDLLEKENIWPEIKQSTREFIVRERSWSGSVARYESVYQSVLDKKQ